MKKLKIEIDRDNKTIVEFVNKTKEGNFSDKDSIPQEYILRFDLPENIDFLNENEFFEQYHFGMIN